MFCSCPGIVPFASTCITCYFYTVVLFAHKIFSIIDVLLLFNTNTMFYCHEANVLFSSFVCVIYSVFVYNLSVTTLHCSILICPAHLIYSIARAIRKARRAWSDRNAWYPIVNKGSPARGIILRKQPWKHFTQGSRGVGNTNDAHERRSCSAVEA